MSGHAEQLGQAYHPHPACAAGVTQPLVGRVSLVLIQPKVWIIRVAHWHSIF
jgi:hypothetical protein